MHRTSKTRLARRSRAGFTLIEIIVALSAGVLVSMAAFSMSRSATAFFQHEARISSAQLALTLGMNRLTADIQRASFMATANAQSDPMVCHDASWPVGLSSFAGITIQPAPSVAMSQAGANGLTPDQIIIGGSLFTSEMFTIQCVVVSGAGAPTLQLQTAVFDNAMARINAQVGPGETLQGKLQLIFVPGRYVNIFDPGTGFHVYGVIGGPVTVTANVATVPLLSTVHIPSKPSSPCGLSGGTSGALGGMTTQCGNGLLVSVVTRMLYDIRSLVGASNTTYAALVAPQAGGVSGDAGRTELVRVELDADGNELPNTLELVSEYAVDMRFGITVSSRVSDMSSKVMGVTTGPYSPTVTSYGIGDPNDSVHTIAGKVTLSASTPQLIRAVQVRLATRTRAPDRSTDLPTGTDGRRLHYLVGTQYPPGYARVRTNYANVALPNQGGFSVW